MPAALSGRLRLQPEGRPPRAGLAVDPAQGGFTHLAPGLGVDIHTVLRVWSRSESTVLAAGRGAAKRVKSATTPPIFTQRLARGRAGSTGGPGASMAARRNVLAIRDACPVVGMDCAQKAGSHRGLFTWRNAEARQHCTLAAMLATTLCLVNSPWVRGSGGPEAGLRVRRSVHG